MHIRDGRLQALADGPLANAANKRVRAHLATCPDCQQRLEALQAERAALDGQLGQLAPDAAQRPRADRALARLHAQLATENKPLIGGLGVRKINLNRNWQRALTGFATVAIVAVLLAFAPVRAAASDLLSIFRLESIVILPVDLQDVEHLESVSYELGSDFFPGDMEVLTEPGDPAYPATLEEASQMAGFALSAPATYPPADEIVLRGQMTTQVEPDLEDMQLLFEAADLSPDLVPPEIDGQSFVFTMPVSVVQIWGTEEADPLVVMQMPSPTVDFPDDVDTEALGVAMLQLLGLSADEAAAMSASIDWSTTLLLPLPTDQISAQPTTVNGVDGFLLRGTPSEDDPDFAYAALLWQKNGVVYLVASAQDESQLTEIANSLQ